MDTWRDTQLQIEYAREEGEERGILKVAKNFLKMGLPVEDVAKATGLSTTELIKLSLQQR